MTDNRVLCAETVMNPLQMYMTDEDVINTADDDDDDDDDQLKFLLTLRYVQESRANAKVSARQPWYIGRNSLKVAQQYQHIVYIVEKYFQCATSPSLTMRVYLHSFSRCCLPNM